MVTRCRLMAGSDSVSCKSIAPLVSSVSTTFTRYVMVLGIVVYVAGVPPPRMVRQRAGSQTLAL